MYFGNRLNFRELIYTSEYYDKLPIVQYLFYIPGALQNLNIWVSFNLCSTIITSFFFSKFIKNLINTYATNNLNRKIINKIILFVIFVYFYLIISIEGSLHHINTIAVNFSILSNYLFFNYAEKNKNYLSFEFVLSAFFAALSISIRPYLALPIFLLPVWISFRKVKINNFIFKIKSSNFKIN